MPRWSDAIVIGGGIFGSSIALGLKKVGFAQVVLMEATSNLMLKASWINQARIHNGYHYPRSRATAIACRENYARFVHDYRDAISRSQDTFYGIARSSSISATQFEAFCDDVGIPCRPDDTAHRTIFDPNAVEGAYSVEESVFDAQVVRNGYLSRLRRAGVDLQLSTRAKIGSWSDQWVEVETRKELWKTKFVVNATYASIDQIGIQIQSGVKRELAELALVRLPRQLSGTSITVMDGPYFSTIPFPTQSAHSLSHVRFTPHCEWTQSDGAQGTGRESHAVAMISDAANYVPLMESAIHLHSMFETKAVLVANEGDDGRPILVERHPESRRILSVLGAKIDNVYDAVDATSEIALQAQDAVGYE